MLLNECTLKVFFTLCALFLNLYQTPFENKKTIENYKVQNHSFQKLLHIMIKTGNHGIVYLKTDVIVQVFFVGFQCLNILNSSLQKVCFWKVSSFCFNHYMPCWASYVPKVNIIQSYFWFFEIIYLKYFWRQAFHKTYALH